MPLSDYKDIVGTAASVTTIAQQFAPAFICLHIIRSGTTKNVESTPFVGGPTICILILQYGLLLNDPVMINVNTFGLILNAIYFSVYYSYTTNKKDLLMSCAKALVFVAALVGYAQICSSENVKFYFGLVVTLMMFFLIASPLFSLGEIIETKSTAKLPFPLILSGTVVSFCWLLYGIIIENIFLQVQNVIALLLCTVQLSLFAIYPSKPPSESSQQKSIKRE